MEGLQEEIEEGRSAKNVEWRFAEHSWQEAVSRRERMYMKHYPIIASQGSSPEKIRLSQACVRMIECEVRWKYWYQLSLKPYGPHLADDSALKSARDGRCDLCGECSSRVS